MFFGVDIGGLQTVQTRLGNSGFGRSGVGRGGFGRRGGGRERREERREDFPESRSLQQRSRARSKYGVPVVSQWKAEIQNVPREMSWQDLKDFCFNKTGVRPTRADLDVGKRLGTLCCATEKEMKSVCQKLDGVNVEGKVLKTVEVPEEKYTPTHDERRPSHRRHSDPHRSERAHRDPTKRHRSDREGSDRHRKKHSTANKADEPKIIIHQPNGDRVITEKLDNNDSSKSADEGHHSENEQTYFKRDRKSGGSGDSRRKRHGVSSSSYQTRFRVRVENLSSEVKWQDLKELVLPYADVKFVEAHKPNPGIGNVHFSSEKGLRKVIKKLNNTDINGLIARFIDETVSEEEFAEQKPRSRSPSRKRRKSTNTSGRSDKRSRSK